MGRKRVSVTSESESGRNQKFLDNYTGKSMTRAGFVREIEQGGYKNYHVREVNGVKTPVSNPGGTEKIIWTIKYSVSIISIAEPC